MQDNHKNNPRTIFSWCLYDFANSAFTTLVVTFIYATYFMQTFAENNIEGTKLWSHAIAISSVAIALLSPFVGALADQGSRKLYLLFFSIVCITGTASLYWITPGQVLLAMTCFIIANIAFEISCNIYNAFLPDITTPDRIGRVSGYGWSLGYAGGLLAMFVALIGLIFPEHPWLGFSKVNGENIRATNLLVAFWFAVFAIPLFLFVKTPPKTASHCNSGIRGSLTQLKNTLLEIRKYRPIVFFLIAHLVYNDGIITIFAFGSLYASGTFHFSMNEVMVFGIVLNIAAGLGAFALGFLDDLLGAKRTIQLSLIGLILASILAISTTSKVGFYIAGILVGIFSGPNQSASRSFMGRLVPPDKENEFFGFYALAGKATSFLGPVLLGLLTGYFQSQRIGISVVIVFFTAGGLLLQLVHEKPVAPADSSSQ